MVKGENLSARFVVSQQSTNHHQPTAEPPAGAAPARFLYKRNPQAAARRPKWPASRSSVSEGWSQSPVLPWAQRAYDARLSAGSTAMLAHGHHLRTAAKLEPPPGVAPSWLPYQRSASLKMLWGL